MALRLLQQLSPPLPATTKSAQEQAATSLLSSRKTKVKAENKHYEVNISVGFHIADVSKDVSEKHFDEYGLFSRYLKIADKSMYEEKRQHKKKKIPVKGKT